MAKCFQCGGEHQGTFSCMPPEPMVERLSGSLWMVTMPGGYTGLNRLGSVYREKEVALRHCDVHEVVVELRLADTPEPSEQHSPKSFMEGYINAADHLLIMGQTEVYDLARTYRDEMKSGEPRNEAASWDWRCPQCGGTSAQHSQAVQLGRCSQKSECAHDWRDAPHPDNLNRMRCRLCGATS